MHALHCSCRQKSGHGARRRATAGALRGERFGDYLADPATTARDQRLLAVQLQIHERLLVRWVSVPCLREAPCVPTVMSLDVYTYKVDAGPANP